MALIKNQIITQRSKHIDIKYHFCRVFFAEEMANLNYIDTKANIADVMTKALNGLKFEQFMAQLVTKS